MKTNARVGRSQAASIAALTVTMALTSQGFASWAETRHRQDQSPQLERRTTPDRPGEVGAGAELAGTAAEWDFDIPAQSLASAIVLFGQQSGLQVSVDGDLLRDLSTPGVRGRMTADLALRRLLAGTRLTYSKLGGTTIVIGKAARPGDDAIRLDPIRVEGTRASAGDPVSGYVAAGGTTATKTETPILDIPSSIQVVPHDVAEDQRALRLKDIYENVSGVQQAGNTLSAQTEVLPLIRGFESPVLLRNGLRTTAIGAVDLVGVERVEVLKGPASTLFGPVEPGGVVNYVTKKPQAEASHTIEGQAGSHEFYRATADATGAVVEDRSLLYRMSAAYTNSGSFRDHMELERRALASSLLWQTTDDTELLLDFSYLHEEQPFDTGIPLDTDGDPLVPRETFFGDPDLEGLEIDDYIVGYQLTHAFDSAWRLRNQFQYHRADASNQSIRARGVDGPQGEEALELSYQNQKREAQELQLVVDAIADFEAGPSYHTILLGAELISQEADLRRFRQNISSIRISDGAEIPIRVPENPPRQVVLGESRWAGFYAQDQVSFLQDGRLKLLFGGRYDILHQESQRDAVASSDVDEQVFTGRAGAVYQIWDQYAAYANVSQSFVPQAPGTLDADGTPLDAEQGLQHELGLKGSFLNDSLFASASVFQIERENAPVSDRELFDTSGQTAFFPEVTQRSRGLELDLAGAVTDRISIIANYSYTDTEVRENDSDPDTIGERLGGVPKHKAGLWMTYVFGDEEVLSGLGFGAGARFVGENTAQFDNTIELDPYVVVDLGVWYRRQGVKFGLNVFNLLDEDYIVRADSQHIAHPGEPMTIITSLSVRF